MVVRPPGEGLRRFTPVASSRIHLLAAALMWTLTGAGLCIVGAVWVLSVPGRSAIPALAAATLAGWLKARLLLSKTARRTVSRIGERGEGHCLGGFLSWRSWLLVAAMILLGRLLRVSPLQAVWRGAIYFAIGAALLFAGRVIWRACGRSRPAC